MQDVPLTTLNVMRGIFTAFFILFICFNLSAQFDHYDESSNWFLGLNMGSVYEQSDIKTVPKVGGGFVFGKSFRKPGRALSFAVRFRYLRGIMEGRDLDSSSDFSSKIYDVAPLSTYKVSPGIIYHNYKTDMHRYALEGVFTLNNLRDRTGLIVSGFGGIGLTNYRTKVDQLGQNDSIYNYPTEHLSKGDLFDIRDGNYETNAEGSESRQVKFMPSLGLELGYQVTSRFSIGLLHKVTFTGHDLMDGRSLNSSNLLGTTNDWYHYTGLSLKWYLGKGKNKVTNQNETNHTSDRPDVAVVNSPNPVVIPPNPSGNDPVIVTPPVVKKPAIQVINPYNNNYTTDQRLFNVRANIYNIDSRNQVLFKQNGIVVRQFNFNPNNRSFSSNINLQPGNNLFEIQARNTAGSAYEARVIILEKPVDIVRDPIVSISSPAKSPYVSNSKSFTVRGSVINVESPEQIAFLVNGRSTRNFNFNPNNNSFFSTIQLEEGGNNVQLIATNTSGRAQASATINHRPIQVESPPVVNFISPSSSWTSTENPLSQISASITNINNAQKLTVTVNGIVTRDFNYIPNTGILKMNINLVEGNNTIEIKAVNNAGKDSKMVNINYENKTHHHPPYIEVKNSTIDLQTVYTNSGTIEANVHHVNSKNDISLKINNVPSTRFTYNLSSEEMVIHSGLIEGANVFEITAVNPYGKDVKSVTIIYKKPQEKALPEVRFIQPNQSPITINTTTPEVHAIVKNVDDKNGIKVKVNGENWPAYTYDTNSKNIRLVAKLIEGANSIEIIGINQWGSDTKSTTIIYKKPIVKTPPVVTVTDPEKSPYNTVNSREIIKATVLNIGTHDEIGFIVNGKIVNNFTYDITSKVFSYVADLADGNNNFKITATNKDGTANKSFAIIYRKPIEECKEPIIKFNTPSLSPYATNKETISVLATVINVKQKNSIHLKVNGLTTDFNFKPSNGSAGLIQKLNNGANTFEITATNDCGNSTKTLIVTYKEPYLPKPPLVTIIEPSNNYHQTDLQNTTVEAMILNVTNRDDISVVMNSSKKTNFEFNASSQLLRLPVTLKEGNNSITITAQNKDGHDKKSTVIIYKKKECLKPLISGLPNKPATSESVYDIKAKIEHVASPSSLTVMINGISTPHHFNVVNGELISSLKLKEGDNAITITATNECGNITKNITVKYTPVTCYRPIITIAAPKVNVTKNETESFIATTKHFSNDDKVNLTLNGQPTDIKIENGKLTGSLKLKSGENVLVVMAENECGNTAEQLKIIYEPCYNPIIKLRTNMVDLHGGDVKLTDNKVSVTAFVSNAKETEIVLKLNNTPQSFEYASGIVKATLKLKEGPNELEITAKTECGIATEKAKATYVAPIPPPVINITKPVSVSSVINTKNSIIQGTIENIKSKDDITIKLNGEPTQNFTYNSANKTFIIPITFDSTNKYLVNIKARNEFTTIQNQLEIIYRPMNTNSVNTGKEIRTSPTGQKKINNIEKQNVNPSSKERTGGSTNFNIEKKSNVRSAPSKTRTP